MTKRNWADGALGNTPLNAVRLNHLESDLDAALVQLARNPEQLFAGAVTRDGDGAPISAVVKWPDGIDGTYAGTASVNLPGSISAYTITRIGPTTITYTQPAVTRGTDGQVTNRPPILVAGDSVEEYLYPDPVQPSSLDAAMVGTINNMASGTRAALSDAYVAASELVINAARYPSAQAALDAAPTGSRVYFPASMSPVTVPTGGLILKTNGLTIDAMGCEFQVAVWGTPAFLALRSNNAGNDHTFRIGMVRYVGTRGNHTGATVRGSAPYCSGSGVWSNGDRNFVEYLRTDGMPTPIFFASWDGVGMNDRTGTGNRIGYLEASGYDFALLYVKQTAFDWGNAYCHDDIDDSAGANPTHAIYCSASSGQRSGSGQIGRWYTERNLYGHAYLVKFADRLTFGSLVSDDCAGVSSFQNVEDMTGDILTGTRIRGIASDRSVVVAGTEISKRLKIGRVDVRKISGDQTPSVGLWVDDRCQIGSITVETEHVAGVATSIPEVLIRGTGSGEVGSITVNAKGVPVRPVELGDGTVAGQAAGWIVPIIRSLGTDAAFNGIPVAEYALSHSNAWGDGGNWLTAAIPAKGIYRRGMRWAASAPSVGAARGWAQTVNGALSGATWAASTAVALGAWVKLADSRVIRYRTAGTTGTTEPNPATIGSTGTDGGATWEYMSATSGTVVSEGNL